MREIDHRTGNSISEFSSLQNPTTPSSFWKRCCSSKSDGFTVIVSCFFVFTLAVTGSLIIQIHFGSSEVTPHGAVATDDQTCSEISIEKIKKGGSAVDATIAALLCLSVTHPHVVGPGGGGVILVHDHVMNESKTFDFMISYPTATDRVGVPGFLKGLEHVHELYGHLPWNSLFGPAIELASHGFNVSKQLSEALTNRKSASLSSHFRNIFFPKGVPAQMGQKIERKKFAKFLQKVAENGADELHLITYGVEMMEAFMSLDANISVHDFHNYEVKERKVVKEGVNNVTIVTAGPPFGGLKVISGLELMKELGIDVHTRPQKLYEAFARGLQLGSALGKIAFSSESAALNETLSLLHQAAAHDFSFASAGGSVRPDVPSAQVSAVDTSDLYVAAVVGIGAPFGSGLMTEHGVVVNGVPATPPSSSDQLDAPFGGQPASAFTPLMVLDAHNVCGERVILSSSSWGSVLQVTSQLVFRQGDMTDAILEPRLALGKGHDVLLVNDFDPHLKKLSSSVREYLKKENFTLRGLYSPSGVNGVSKLGDTLASHSDTRGGGVAARLQQFAPMKDSLVDL